MKLSSCSWGLLTLKIPNFLLLFSSWWITGPVGSVKPYLSFVVPSASRVTICFILWSSPQKVPSTARLTKPWITYASKWVIYRCAQMHTSQGQMGWNQTEKISHWFPVRCMINSWMLPLAVPHPPPPPSFSAPPRTLTPPLLWCSSSSLCSAQLDAPSHSNILTHLQHLAMFLLYQVVSLGFCGQNVLVQLFVFTFKAWQMLCGVVSSHLS